MKIFTTNDDCQFSKKICQHLGVGLSPLKAGVFSDGETRVEVEENVRGQDVFIVQSVCPPVNDNLMKLLLTADAMRLASARTITAVTPYLGYARQDRRVQSKRVPISARLVADLIESAGFNRIMTVDLHSDQVQGFFHIPVENIGSSVLITDFISKQKLGNNFLIVSPDVGGVERAQAVAKNVGADLVVIDKRRSGANQVDTMQLVGDAAGRDCWIIDDMIDTGHTLARAALLLKENGAHSVNAYCTHGVLSGRGRQIIADSQLDQLYISDSIAGVAPCQKIQVLSLTTLVADAIGRVAHNESLSEMYL